MGVRWMGSFESTTEIVNLTVLNFGLERQSDPLLLRLKIVRDICKKGADIRELCPKIKAPRWVHASGMELGAAEGRAPM